MRKKSLTILLAAVLAASLLSGCGSGKAMMNQAVSTDSAAGAMEAPAMAVQEEYLYDAGYGEYGYDMPEEEIEYEDAVVEGEAASVTETQAEEVSDPQAGRKLITTMNLNAETEYFDELMGNLERQVAELGGYIESSDQWNGGSDYYGNRLENRNAYLTIRIPAEKLGSFLTLMEESTNITSKSKSVEDVTLAYVDLESHKKALLTEQERLLELMEMAETVEDLITVEDKLANVRYQLESMESQLRTYDNKINYSTVYLQIQEVKRLTPVEEPTTWGRIKSGFSENLYKAGEAIRNVFIGIIINIPFIAIWLVILAVVFLIVFLLAKNEKKKKAKRLQKKEQMQILVNTPVMQKSVPEGEKLPKKLEPAENEKEMAENKEETSENKEEIKDKEETEDKKE